MLAQETNARIYAIPAVYVNSQSSEPVRNCTLNKPEGDFLFNSYNYLTNENAKLDLPVHSNLIIPVNVSGNHWFIAFMPKLNETTTTSAVSK